MKKIFICTPILLCLLLLAGCGGIYAGYREVEQLAVVQTMGFDLSPEGVRLSVSTGGDGTPIRMAAEAESVSIAEQEIQDYSAAEEIFYAHTGYLVLGEEAARAGLAPWLDFVRRSPQLRLDTPLFTVMGDSASTLVLGSGGDGYDATNVLRSTERNLDKRLRDGVFSVRDVLTALDTHGAALVCAVRCVPASDALYGTDGGLTALPDGYAVIADGAMQGHIPEVDAYAVALLRGDCGDCRLELDGAAVQLTELHTSLDGQRLELRLRAALLETGGGELDEISAALERRVLDSVDGILALSRRLGCDFLGLGLPEGELAVTVTAAVERSFDTDTEAGDGL